MILEMMIALLTPGISQWMSRADSSLWFTASIIRFLKRSCKSPTDLQLRLKNPAPHQRALKQADGLQRHSSAGGRLFGPAPASWVERGMIAKGKNHY